MLPQTVIGLALLSALTIFGYTGHVTQNDTYIALMGFIGLVGASGLYVLASNWANINALPQLIVGIAIIAALVVLGLHNVFNSGQLSAVLALLLTGTGVGAGGVVVTGAVRSLAQGPKQVPEQ